MNKVFVRFRGGEQGIVSENEALKITEMFAEYTDKRKDGLLKLPNGKRVRVSNLEVMEDWKEPEKTPLPIERALEESTRDEQNPEKRTLKEHQLTIFRHNKQCIATGKMDQYIWYYIQNGKIIKTTKEALQKMMKEREKQQLLKYPGVKSVTEVNGQLSIGL